MATFIVVDDSRIARSFLKTILTEIGHEVIGEASNGEEGYELYSKLMPDIITVDITMPVLDGIGCLKKIKNDYPKAKVIMVTSIGSERNREAAIAGGATGYIVKPIDPDGVAEVVEACIMKKV